VGIVDKDQAMPSATLDDVRAVKAKAMAIFSPLAEVVGIGITRIGEGYGLKVNLRIAAGKNAQLPTDVDGIPVKVEIVGRLTKQ
jgi:hypothetical protein